MNVWAWIWTKDKALRASGHERLADLMGELPTAVCADEHARVDAIVPEALALAQALDEPWIQVFLRHWHLQSRVLHRYEGAAALSEAVDLLDFAHTERARDCPQTVCAVQDLCNAYENLDGPGYREERLTVSEETLARIDPTWACYECIHTEHASAFLEGATAEQRLSYIDQYVARRLSANRDAKYEMCAERVNALIMLEQYEEAFEFNRRALRVLTMRAKTIRARIDAARLHALLGRAMEAQVALPEWSEIEPTASFYAAWADAQKTLVDHGARPNDDTLAAYFDVMVSRLESIGNARRAFNLAATQAELALGRGDAEAAERAIATMTRTYEKLRKPLDATEKLSAMRRAVASART